jgi:hypothetical protein
MFANIPPAGFLALQTNKDVAAVLFSSKCYAAITAITAIYHNPAQLCCHGMCQ